MQRNIKGILKKTAPPIIIVSMFLVLLLADVSGVFNFLELKTYDFRVRLFADSYRTSDEVIVVLLDQPSIDWAVQERGWSWPWPRKAYAELIDYMNLAGASAVAFDVIFSEPSVYGPEDDEAFIRADRDFNRTVHTVFFSSTWNSVYSWPRELDTKTFELSGFDPVISRYNLLNYVEDAEERQIGAQLPIPGLMNTAGAIGNIATSLTAESDRIVRRAWLFNLFDGKAIPGLSAASLLVSGSDMGIAYDEKARVIRWGDYTIPVGKNGGSLLRFKGGSLDKYWPYSAKDILQSAEVYANGEEPLLPPEDFTGKYVFFGLYAAGLFDICSTPLSTVYPGMGVHITMLDNILNDDFIRESPAALAPLMSFFVIAIMVILVLYSSHISLTLAGSVTLITIIIGTGFFTYYLGYWVPIVFPLSGAIFAFLAASIYKYATEGSQKRFIKSAFSQYLSPAVIEQLLANPERLSLGGERREISIFFSDIQGFTSISEKLDPSKLTELLNEYLSFMTDTILDSGGTIDKYEGDAIIAFWNAPVPYEDHAARALEASMACQQLLTERQDFFYKKYGCHLLTRIGLNTGYAVVGNMGSSKRFDYTMLGDAVNLAARLEGLNKQFGTYVMCTEAAFTQAGKTGSFWGRKLAQVAVVGKQEAVTVYEPMPQRVFAEAQGILRRFDAARDLFYQGRFAEALPLFQVLASEDKPSWYYAKQCEYYQKHPVAWKGFWQANTK
ncbi:MAG: adenylate/guanylate cyclase domain-containing protein [Treponema sp.]|jgi:adenylate cyclase|nr:adenylate/guanylate cyclase domain-containing protein [Treponema sp.]